ncbi:PilN domain-containing protein [Oceanobacillus indicireducens]|uniref:Fimbrial assembly protein n=1 Tax=Oceanobacillus indicireducens TaxID=1004261 RepID=A0A917XQY9_9BACI|nr:hypothetical protein [Oceanobacillus indicireducens]GGN48879.1 hypothetical protein GCM10007971_00970 [Oceanobacillus indicireducens]
MLPEVNLLPKSERAESRLYSLFFIGLILIVLASGLLIYFYFKTSSDLEDAEARVAALNKEKTILETRLSSLDTENETTTLTDALAYAESYQLPTSKLVDEFITLLPDHAYLSRFEFDYHSIMIETQFETIPAASIYVADLTESDLLEEVIIEEVLSLPLYEEEDDEEEINAVEERYEFIPRYAARYSMQVDHQSLVRKGENDETAISGE